MQTQLNNLKRNPRAHLADGVTPIQRARQKRDLILEWIYAWHTTAAPIVAGLLGTTESNYLKELERQGYLTSFAAPTLLCGRAYLLTRDGVNYAAASLGIELPYSIYPSSVSHALLKHNLAAQRACLPAHADGAKIIPGRLLAAASGHKVPDALLERNGSAYALELELSGKWGDELEQTLCRLIEHMPNWKGVIYVSNSKALLDRYEARLNLPIAKWWVHKEVGRPNKWCSGMAEKISPDVRAKFIFRCDTDLLKGFERLK